jgi:hypothetical protein
MNDTELLSKVTQARKRLLLDYPWLCAGHVQQFGGASPPANLMEVKAK